MEALKIRTVEFEILYFRKFVHLMMHFRYSLFF